MSNEPNPRAELDRAQNLVQGKGFFGWLTRLFMGKSTSDQFSAGISQAQGYLDQAELQQRLLSTGVPARATVNSIQDTGALVNYNPVVDLNLHVQPEGLPAFPVQLRTPVSKIAIPRVGETVNVKYNPQNPQELVIVQ